MNWVLVNYASTTVQKYHLVEGSSKKVILKYNHLQQSVRISNDTRQRVFFIEKTGFWNNRTIFENEYGIETGGLSFEKGLHTGTIELDGRKHHFAINDKDVQELVIYDQDINQPLAVCNYNPLGHENEQDYIRLLLGLCWYLFPVTAGETTEYATRLTTV